MNPDPNNPVTLSAKELANLIGKIGTIEAMAKVTYEYLRDSMSPDEKTVLVKKIIDQVPVSVENLFKKLSPADSSFTKDLQYFLTNRFAEDLEETIRQNPE
ncbi:hypothetical protein [Spirosoma endophyticum]|uniref:Uncharacterized protein n=1 Tax=Spirosoma endophyticum TaxID=662367 RepID=A0A1I1Q3M8_9BACT|nr:hypothetical protein [Spirosoma endophyticum]SFD13823.1 hypothetical protein SAMN05216167_103457 [Spirosoma endophyticum]